MNWRKLILVFIMFCSFISQKVYTQVIAEGISESDTLDSQPPKITLYTPNGGEVYLPGDSVSITWSATDSSFGSNPINLFYSIDGGVNYIEIQTNLENSGSYTWKVPNNPSENVLVKVSGVDLYGLEGFDVSDAVFKIDGPPNPPQNIALTVSDHAITLTWDASDEGDVNRYIIYRDTTSGFEMNSSSVLDTVFAPDTSFTDSLVVHGITYYYVVTAMDSMGNESVASSELSGTAYILGILSVTFSQRRDGSKIVDIYYSFVGNPDGSYKITPYVRLSSEDDWVECQHVTGDTGEGIKPGDNKNIIWEFGKQMGEVYSSRAQIKIEATEQEP